MTYYDPSYNYYEVETPLSPTAVAPPQPRPLPHPVTSRRRGIDPVHQRMLFILGAVMFIAPLLAFFSPSKMASATIAPVQTQVAASGIAAPDPAAMVPAVSSVQSALSPVFSREVRHWEPQILEWSAKYGVDPDITATIMQIESCGDPLAISRAGAQGLFQVMPFHFSAGEDSLDPDTNARRGLNYFVERMGQTNGNIGKSFAGYNGGHVAAAGNWDTWVHETQRYYVWSTGIYGEAKEGLTVSPTLQKWMEAGGASLCRQAANRLGI